MCSQGSWQGESGCWVSSWSFLFRLEKTWISELLSFKHIQISESKYRKNSGSYWIRIRYVFLHLIEFWYSGYNFCQSHSMQGRIRSGLGRKSLDFPCFGLRKCQDCRLKKESGNPSPSIYGGVHLFSGTALLFLRSNTNIVTIWMN